MSTSSPITVRAEINSPIARVWEYWTKPEHIVGWNFASDDWCCPKATSDLREGGKFSSRMEAKDGSFGFDFEGTFTKVVPHKQLDFSFGDRTASVTFEDLGGKTRVTETFIPENENPVEMQRQGWQAILDNFKKYTESR